MQSDKGVRISVVSALVGVFLVLAGLGGCDGLFSELDDIDGTGGQLECTQDEQCEDGTCEDNRCVDGGELECTEDEQCEDGTCEDNRCVNGGELECSNQEECEGEQQCVDGRCIGDDGACTDVTDCGGDLICDDGECIEPNDDLCVENQDCTDGVCEDSECVECAVSGDCPAGVCEDSECVECVVSGDCRGEDVCEDSQCVECVIDQDCPEGYFCDEGCHPEEPNGEQCEGEEEFEGCSLESIGEGFCVEGQCRMACSNNDDCKDEYGENWGCESPIEGIYYCAEEPEYNDGNSNDGEESAYQWISIVDKTEEQAPDLCEDNTFGYETAGSNLMAVALLDDNNEYITWGHLVDFYRGEGAEPFGDDAGPYDVLNGDDPGLDGVCPVPQSYYRKDTGLEVTSNFNPQSVVPLGCGGHASIEFFIGGEDLVEIEAGFGVEVFEYGSVCSESDENYDPSSGSNFYDVFACKSEEDCTVLSENPQSETSYLPVF